MSSILEQPGESWIIAICNLNHEGHSADSKNFFSHWKNKVLDNDDLDYVKHLIHAKVNPQNISKILVNRTGKDYNYRDVVNMIARIQRDEKSCPMEQVLGSIREEVGEVKYSKSEDTNNVDVLWVQTREMKDHLHRI